MKKRMTTLSIVVSLAALLVAGCAGSAKETSFGEGIDDSVITVKVKGKLAASEQTDAYDIEVETFKGIVQLSGFVNTLSEKQAASRIAREVGGVTDVENDIIVKP